MKRGRIPIRATNQFLLYRTALIKTLRELGYQDFNMRLISKLASDFWNHEPEYVQAAYKRLANHAKTYHNKTMKSSKKSSRNNNNKD
ncbi:16094_t:CDS:1, partial [Entrophospora sp. SA101]